MSAETYAVGERVSLSTGPGTVLSQEEALEQYEKNFLSLGKTDRYITFILLDNGNMLAVDTTADERGFTLDPVYPKNWPPQAKDVWRDEDNDNWVVVWVDFGHRSGLRLVRYGDNVDTVRSAGEFLREHPTAKLRYRFGVDIEN